MDSYYKTLCLTPLLYCSVELICLGCTIAGLYLYDLPYKPSKLHHHRIGRFLENNLLKILEKHSNKLCVMMRYLK